MEGVHQPDHLTTVLQPAEHGGLGAALDGGVLDRLGDHQGPLGAPLLHQPHRRVAAVADLAHLARMVTSHAMLRFCANIQCPGGDGVSASHSGVL